MSNRIDRFLVELESSKENTVPVTELHALLSEALANFNGGPFLCEHVSLEAVLVDPEKVTWFPGSDPIVETHIAIFGGKAVAHVSEVGNWTFEIAGVGGPLEGFGSAEAAKSACELALKEQRRT